MATEIVPFAPDHHLAAVAEFSRTAWQRPRSPAYLRWRYVEPSFHRAYLAMRDGKCLAMVSAFRRPYLAGKEILSVCDSFDWYCLPELRNSGLGVRVLQRLMQDPDPVIVTGGTRDTRDLLPRMGFRTLDEVRRFVLPLGANRLTEALARRTGIPRGVAYLGSFAAQSWFKPRPRGKPPGGRVIATSTVGEEATSLDPRSEERGTIPLWTAEFLRWLSAGFPGMGHFIPLYFAVGDSLEGWALLRIFETENGCDAALLDARARTRDEAFYSWMVSEAALRAECFGAGLLTAGTTCPALEAALRRNRFRQVESAPIHFFSGKRDGLPEPVMFNAHWGDEPLVPYPTSWWDDPREGLDPVV